MKARILPELPDQETETESVFTWKIENWRNLPKKERGPIFQCGGHPWWVPNLPRSFVLKGSWWHTDRIEGGYYSFPTATTLNTHRSTSSKAMRINRQTIGTHACNLPWCYGIQTIPRSTSNTVGSPNLSKAGLELMGVRCSCKSPVQCRRGRLGLYQIC